MLLHGHLVGLVRAIWFVGVSCQVPISDSRAFLYRKRPFHRKRQAACAEDTTSRLKLSELSNIQTVSYFLKRRQTCFLTLTFG